MPLESAGYGSRSVLFMNQRDIDGIGHRSADDVPTDQVHPGHQVQRPWLPANTHSEAIKTMPQPSAGVGHLCKQQESKDGREDHP